MKNDLEPTEQYFTKPNLQWFGKLWGCDLYIDTRNQSLRRMAEQLIKELDDHGENRP